MLEVVQASQIGKTDLLLDMHRMRKRVFCDRLQWNINISRSGLEVDQFDTPDAVYILSVDQNRRVLGSWRLLPTTGITMIGEIWPDFLKSIKMPASLTSWEGSRLSVDKTLLRTSGGHLGSIGSVTHELFCGLTELCIYMGIKEVFTLYDTRIARLVKRLNCYPAEVSERHFIDGLPVEVGRYVTDKKMLMQLQDSAGIYTPLINTRDLPPAFLAMMGDTRRSFPYAAETQMTYSMRSFHHAHANSANT